LGNHRCRNRRHSRLNRSTAGRVPGLYNLVLYLERPCVIQVGKLGRFHFQRGYYIYTGSARGGLDQRLRHYSKDPSSPRWHIDYLRKHARLIKALCYANAEIDECALNDAILALRGATVPVKGFGSSDCSCISHLAFFSAEGGLPAQIQKAKGCSVRAP